MLLTHTLFRQILNRMSSRCRTSRRQSPRRGYRAELLEERLVLAASLGTTDLIYDPTPDSVGGEVDIGSITYERLESGDTGYVAGNDNFRVTYSILGGANQTKFDLSEIHTKINDGDLGSADTTGLSSNSAFHVVTLTGDPTTSLTIQACATIDAHNADALDAALPTVGTVRVDTGGVIVPPASYFDTIISTGFIPSSTDVDNNTVTFNTAPGWSTGDAVRVVASFGADVTGLVTPPVAGDSTTSASYYLRNLGANTYSFHTTYLEATTGANPKDITAAVPTTGEIVVVGENDVLPFLGQVPLNESFTPTSSKIALTTTTGPLVTATDTTATVETVDLATVVTWVNGDRVQVSATGGGLTAGTTYFIRVIDSDTISFHTSWANAQSNTKINLTAALALTTTVNKVDGDDETVTFATDPGWATGTGVRVFDGGNNLSGSTTYFVRNLGSGTYSFYDTFVNASKLDTTDLTGRKDLITTINVLLGDSVFANLTTLTFAEDHGWVTGAVVRATASSGGLTLGTNYFVRKIDDDTISLHTTLANAQGNISPVTFTAPVTSVISPMFNGWCVDNDTFIGGNEYIVNVYSSYEASSFPDTSFHPNDQFGTDAGLFPVNTTATPLSTNTTSEVVTFTAATGWATSQAVRVTADDGVGLSAGTTYYVRISGSTAIFYDTAANATAGLATGKINLTGSVTSTVYRAESIDLASTTLWPNGTRIKVTVDDGGLLASGSYYARAQDRVGGVADANSISLYNTRANAQAGGAIGLITLTSPIETTTKFYVPENLVENPENLDVLNWVLNQNYQYQLAAGIAPTATNTATNIQVPASTSDANVGAVPDTTNVTAESVNYLTDPAFVTATLVRVTATGGGLTAGTNYFIRNLLGGDYSFYNSAANATAGTATGRSNLTANITAGVFTPSLSSTEDTVTFASGHGFATGNAVNVTTSVGGLTTTTTYFLYNVSGDTFSFHTAAAATAANKVNLTAAIAGVRLQSDDTVTMPATPAPTGWATGMVVQVSATGGGLTAGTDYFIRVLGTNTLAFYNTPTDASSNVNRIDLTAAVEPVRAYFTEGDIQRTVWALIENNPGDPGYSAARVNEILAAADAAVGLDQASIDFIPDCEGTISLLLQPFEVNQVTNAQTTIAQITVATVPNFCVTGTSCAEVVYSVSISDALDVHVCEGETAVNSGTFEDISTTATVTVTGGGSVSSSGGTWNWSGAGLDVGNYTITVTASDGYLSDSTTFEVEVGNFAPSVTSVVVSPSGAYLAGVTEVTVSGTWTDPGLPGGGETYSGTINWGDGPDEEITVNGDGTYTSGGHTYATGDAYIITVTITDSNGPTDEGCEGGADVGITEIVVEDPLASLGNFVWVDTDSDGQQDEGEPGLDGVTVTLTGAGLDGDFLTLGDNTTATTTTSGGGAYSFTGLTPGSYTVTFGAVAGYSRTVADTGADGSDSDANVGTGTTGVYTLVAGQANITVDAGYFKNIKISGTKYQDKNGDGFGSDGVYTSSTGDSNLITPTTTFTMMLYRESNGTAGLQIDGDEWVETVSTSALDGTYCFTTLVGPGTYYVDEGVAASDVTNWIQTAGGNTNSALDLSTAYYTNVVSVSGQNITKDDFANAHLGGKNGLTIGFWSNSNGQKLITGSKTGTKVSTEVVNVLTTFLSHTTNSANSVLVDSSGNYVSKANLCTYSNLRNILLKASASNMASMLSAQLLGTVLNCHFSGQTGILMSDTLYVQNVKTSSGSNRLSGGMTIQQALYDGGTGVDGVLDSPTEDMVAISKLVTAAREELSLHPVTASGHTDRNYQEALKNCFDAINNNNWGYAPIFLVSP